MVRKLWQVMLILGWVGVVGAGVVWMRNGADRANEADLAEVSELSEKSEVRKNLYLIASMREREYDSSIKTERKVRETDKFTSYVVSFESDGLKQYALMNEPKDQRPNGGWPVVIVNHGHIEPEIYSVENSYINTSAYFANAGFLVVKPDYRGHDNSEGDAGGLISRISYAADVLNLIAGVKKLPNANINRIYMYGHSMGGDVSLRVLEVCQNCVKAATLWAPAVRDFPESYLYFSRRGPDTPQRIARRERFQRELAELFLPSEYQLISAFDNVNLVTVPVNIHHGTNDESVPYEWGEMVVQKFVEAGKEHYFYSYQRDNHDIARNWGTALSRDVELFRNTL